MRNIFKHCPISQNTVALPFASKSNVSVLLLNLSGNFARCYSCMATCVVTQMLLTEYTRNKVDCNNEVKYSSAFVWRPCRYTVAPENIALTTGRSILGNANWSHRNKYGFKSLHLSFRVFKYIEFINYFKNWVLVWRIVILLQIIQFEQNTIHLNAGHHCRFFLN